MNIVRMLESIGNDRLVFMFNLVWLELSDFFIYGFELYVE